MDGSPIKEKNDDTYPPQPSRGRQHRSSQSASPLKTPDPTTKPADSDARRPYSTFDSPASTTSSSSSSSSDLPASKPLHPWIERVSVHLRTQFGWVFQNTDWSKVKPVIRCALVAWASLVLFVIPAVELVLGQASFLILIGVVLSPPSDPFLSVLEREILILIFVCITWAWSCLGLFLADLARTIKVPTATIFDVADGKYVEAVPSVIIGVFIFVGSSAILAFRAKQGPGPFLFPCILACLCINICLTTGALFPYPFYLIGRSIVVPLAIHSALSLLASLLIFPSTISALFTTRLSDTLTPSISLLSSHTTLLNTTPLTAPTFAPLLSALRSETKKIEASLVPLAAARRLLANDVIYGRFAPGDFTAFQGMLRRLSGRADGLGVFFSLVDPERERFPGTGGVTPVTVPGTPRVGMSRVTTRAPSLEREGDGEVVEVTTSHDKTTTPTTTTAGAPLSPVATSKRSIKSQPLPSSHTFPSLSPTITNAPLSSPIKHSHSYSSSAHTHLHLHTHTHSHSHSHLHHHHHALLHSSLLSLAKARAKKPEHAVGTFESQRYLNLEATTLWDPNEAEWNLRIGGLLKESCTPLLESCAMGLGTVKDWLSTVRESRIKELVHFWIGGESRKGGEDGKASGEGDINSQEGKGTRRDNFRKRREDRIEKIREVRRSVERVLEEFRRVHRHKVLEPYRHAFESQQSETHRNSETPPTSHTHHHTEDSNQAENANLYSYSSYDDVPPAKGDREQDNGSRKEHESDHNHHHSQRTPAHRYLFNCFVYQYNLLQIASIVLEMLDEILRLEAERTRCRLWTPAERVFSWKPWLIADTVEHLSDDDDPDIIQGINRNNPDIHDVSKVEAQTPPRPMGHAYPSNAHQHPHTDMPSKFTGPAFPLSSDQDLGLPKRRDPDALPPRNIAEALMGLCYKLLASLGTDGVLFGVKAGLLTVALSLPSLFKNSAGFAYDNRFVWGIFMGQLTIARFRGDTIFGISARIISTFFGAIMGMIIWYISCGNGTGNPYGLSAVCAVVFPFFFFARLYWPIPPMRNIVFFVTIILVIGYSYQDQHINVPGAPGVGWPVAWKRFTLVTAGVVAAFVASFFPPSTTIRLYQRRLLATTSSELGTIYCAIISFANTKHEPEIQEIVSSLIAVRNKLAKSAGMRGNVVYEFSFKGRWPADRYQRVADLQVGISYCLSHLMSVLEHLEPAWSRAFLRRTRFMDPGFQGDVLAVISMISSSLRTGNPLPQITPCPLIDRFLLKYHGLDVIHKDAEEDYGLPRSLSIDTLKDEQYLMFSVGISTAFGIINRLDRLMIATKEIVGEQYHIHGVGFVRAPVPNDHWTNNGERTGGGGGVEMGPRTNTVHFDDHAH